MRCPNCNQIMEIVRHPSELVCLDCGYVEDGDNGDDFYTESLYEQAMRESPVSEPPSEQEIEDMARLDLEYRAKTNKTKSKHDNNK